MSKKAAKSKSKDIDSSWFAEEKSAKDRSLEPDEIFDTATKKKSTKSALVSNSSKPVRKASMSIEDTKEMRPSSGSTSSRGGGARKGSISAMPSKMPVVKEMNRAKSLKDKATPPASAKTSSAGLKGTPPTKPTTPPISNKKESGRPAQGLVINSADDTSSQASAMSKRQPTTKHELATSESGFHHGGSGGGGQQLVSSPSLAPNSSMAGSPRTPGAAMQTPTTRFEVLRDKELGQGNFGKVFKAFDQGGTGFCAVKIAHVGRENAADILKALKDEYNMLKTLRHPNIVRVLHFDVEGAESRIFMEWMPGGSVYTTIRQSNYRLHELMVRKMAKEALEGLAFLHDRGIIHRDIKPANMLVGGDGTVKLSDFGTCKTVVQATATSTQTTVGTPVYMPREAINNPKHTPGMDMWAMACSIVEMATGRIPWGHLPMPDLQTMPLMFRICFSEPPNHCPEIPSHLSQELRDILVECFDIDYAKRPSAKSVLSRPYFTREDLPKDAETFEKFSAGRPSTRTQLEDAYPTNILYDGGSDGTAFATYLRTASSGPDDLELDDANSLRTRNTNTTQSTMNQNTITTTSSLVRTNESALIPISSNSAKDEGLKQLEEEESVEEASKKQHTASFEDANEFFEKHEKSAGKKETKVLAKKQKQ